MKKICSPFISALRRHRTCAQTEQLVSPTVNPQLPVYEVFHIISWNYANVAISVESFRNKLLITITRNLLICTVCPKVAISTSASAWVTILHSRLPKRQQSELAIGKLGNSFQLYRLKLQRRLNQQQLPRRYLVVSHRTRLRNKSKAVGRYVQNFKELII